MEFIICHLTSLSSCVGVRTFKCYFLRKFQLYNSVINCSHQLYIRASEFIHFIAESLYPFTNLSQFFLNLTASPAPFPIPGNQYSNITLKNNLLSFFPVTNLCFDR